MTFVAFCVVLRTKCKEKEERIKGGQKPKFGDCKTKWVEDGRVGGGKEEKTVEERITKNKVRWQKVLRNSPV